MSRRNELPAVPVAAGDGNAPETIAAVLDKAAPAPQSPAKAAKPMDPTPPKVPGEKGRQRGRQAGKTRAPSMHPEAVRARERRAQSSARRPRELTPAELRPPTSSTAPPPSGAFTGPVAPLPVLLTPDQRTAGARSAAGIAKVLGTILAGLFGDEWLVSDDDASAVGSLAVDAHPEWFTGNGDGAKLMFYGAVGGMLVGRVRKTRARRQAARGLPGEVQPSSPMEAPHDAPAPRAEESGPRAGWMAAGGRA